MKRGFTMIETIVVLGIFSVLLTAGANFLISMTRNNSRITTQNEVRQEASKIMQDIITEARRADEYRIMTNGDLITASASGTTTYHLDSTILRRNNAKFSSENVTVPNFNASSVNNSLVIVLTVQQKDESITLTDTVTPRTY